MDRLILAFLVIGLVITGIVWLFDLFFKKKWVKYILVVIPAVVAVISMIQAYMPSEGFEDLGSFLMAMLSIAAAVSALIACVTFDVVRKRKNK